MQLTQRHAGLGRARASLDFASGAYLGLAVLCHLSRDSLLSEPRRATPKPRTELAR
ncbi:hypothetical protein BX592_101172 [Paraburkholderia rhizosphaerae]|uniref:Uncharacterized protein n=1 Tax=Paraburkholderia rhizosphaerae TaxID=480658 RepID=A0A4R8M0E3_9BURK|nr:hypothetical protein BX592_101172 [Paraburkholderia rhizosphaerae]